MPLHDHFHPPVEDIAPWTSICSFWVVGVAKYLNSRLPGDRYRALATTHLGSHLEADISEFESDGGMTFRESNGHGGLATLTAPTAFRSLRGTQDLIRAHPRMSRSRRSVRNMCPGLCVIAKGGLACINTACGVTPQAQNTGTSPGLKSTLSP